MKLKDFYPINIRLVKNRKHFLADVFRKVRPHKGMFVGVCLLNGCFMWESVSEIFSALGQGEKLLLRRSEGSASTAPYSAFRLDGSFIGELPFCDSVVPNILISRGIDVFCYVEAKEFNGGLPEVAVSVYCEDY